MERTQQQTTVNLNADVQASLWYLSLVCIFINSYTLHLHLMCMEL